MQKKTINKIIKGAITNWLDSITDLDLRKDIEKSLIVSGGCISSLFLNEKVNDYDIYLSDIKVAERIAEYYTKSYTNIEVLSYSNLNELLTRIKDRENSAYGHAINNLKPGQVKLFFADKNGGFAPGKKEDESKISKYTPVFFSANAISLSDDIQIVLRFTGTPAEIHKNYDFVHATAYFTMDTGVVTHQAALESLLSKTLQYQGSLYPLTSMIRIKKFLKRGWTISAGEMLKIMFQISELDLKNPLVLEEQLVGIDVTYFSKLIDILAWYNKDEISSEFLNTIIDKVFNADEETED